MHQKLKIYISPKIREKFYPEVSWIWRMLLTSMGYCWEVVDEGCSSCDIAYISDIGEIERYALCIKADVNLWNKKSDLRLQNFDKFGELSCPIFRDSHDPNLELSINNSQILCEKDIIFDLFWLITGQEEKYWIKNKHGQYILPDNKFIKNQAFCKPLASRIVRWLEDKFLDLGFLPPFPRWPYSKKAAACASHDVDYPEIRRFLEPLRIMLRKGFSGISAATDVILGKKNYWNFPLWVEMEKNLKFRSAFYFVPIQGSLLAYALGRPDPFYDIKSEPFRSLFQFLSDEGFEIGLHSSYLAFTDIKKIETERQVLQEVSGKEIGGNRHHYWHLDPNDPESTLKFHEQAGLKYDTSLTHERFLGWRRCLSWPFFPFHQKERRELKTLQIQTAWMDDHLFGYAKNNPGDRREALRFITNIAADQGGCILVDVHDYVFDDQLFTGWSKTYFWLMEHILDRSDFWIATPGEVADHWIKRYRSILKNSDGLRLGLN